jgi:hypothetical protein
MSGPSAHPGNRGERPPFVDDSAEIESLLLDLLCYIRHEKRCFEVYQDFVISAHSALSAKRFET